MTQLAQSALASAITILGGTALGAAAASVLGASSHVRAAVPPFELFVLGGVMAASAALGFIASALQMRVWPGVAVVALLFATVAIILCRNNLWQAAHAFTLFALPLVLGVTLREAVAHAIASTRRRTSAASCF